MSRPVDHHPEDFVRLGQVVFNFFRLNSFAGAVEKKRAGLSFDRNAGFGREEVQHGLVKVLSNRFFVGTLQDKGS